MTKTSQDNNWIIISTYSLWPLIILFGFFIEKDNFMTIDEKFKSRKFLLDRGMYFCILKTATYIDSNLEYTLKDM